MRILYLTVQTLLFLLFSLSGDAQTGNADLRFSNVTVDCANQELLVDIEAKASQGEAFFLHNQNYRFNFDTLTLANPSIDQELAPSGLIDFGAGGISLFAPHNLNGSLGEVVSYNVIVSGGDGYPLNDSTWVGIGRLKFDILNIDGCFDLNWHRSDVGPFPSTTLLGSESGMLFLLGETVTDGLDQCFDAECGAFEVRINPVDIDCENSRLFVDLEIRASGPNAGFNLGNQNYRFTFDESVLANPMIEQELVISGQVQEGGTNNFYNPHTTTGSVSNIVSYNVTLAFGEGYPVGTDWVGIGRLVFDILDVNSCANFDWNTDDPADFPNTIIVGLDGNNLFYEVQPEAYINNTVCFDECQTTSIETLSEEDIRVFPSITAGPVTIVLDGKALNQSWELQILNPLGQIVSVQQVEGSQTQHQLDFSAYASGSYQILLRSTNHFKVATVIKSE
ncbi:MAG: hypothetical protein AAFV80_11425 [Bacteroidota bacterium]